MAVSPGFPGAHPWRVMQSSALAADFQLQQNNMLSPGRQTLPADLCADNCVPWKMTQALLRDMKYLKNMELIDLII